MVIIIIIIFISKGFLKQLTIKTNGKNSRRFDRSSVIIKRNVENKNLHGYIYNISLDNDGRAVEMS